MKDYYGVLGIPEGASEKQIRSVYRKLSPIYHPDTTALDKKYAEERFKEIGEAHSILTDPRKRAEYDRLRKARTSAGRSGTGSSPPPSDSVKLVVSPRSLNFGTLQVGEQLTKSFIIDNRGNSIDGTIELLVSEDNSWFSFSRLPRSKVGFPVKMQVRADTRNLDAGQRYEGWIEVHFGGASATVDLVLATKEDGMEPEIVLRWDPPEAANADFFYDMAPGEKRQAFLWVMPKFPDAGPFRVRVAEPVPSWMRVSPMSFEPPQRVKVEVIIPEKNLRPGERWTGQVDLEIVLDE